MRQTTGFDGAGCSLAFDVFAGSLTADIKRAP